jgi:hypothetical protein
VVADAVLPFADAWLVCVARPSPPGLPTRTETLTLLGSVCDARAVELVFPWSPAEVVPLAGI